MSTPQDERGYYMVRAMDQTEKYFDFFFDEGVVAVGWSEVDLRPLSSKAEVSEALGREYDFWDEYDPRVRGRKENQILHFNGIEEGDRIVVPYYSSVALATATGVHRYAAGEGKELDLANIVEVEYLRTADGVAAVSRDELSEGLARRLRVRGSTVSVLREFANEIEDLFSNEGLTWQTRLAREDEERRTAFRQELLQNIRSGKTNLESGGRGLENLVEELLRLEGYSTAILSTQAFDGKADADVEGTRSDRFGEHKLLVQVKHHKGNSGETGLQQLLDIEKEGDGEYSDYKLVLVTTGDVSEELRARAERKAVDVLEGEEFMDWLLDSVDDLAPETRRKLGISEVPELTL